MIMYVNRINDRNEVLGTSYELLIFQKEKGGKEMEKKGKRRGKEGERKGNRSELVCVPYVRQRSATGEPQYFKIF
jgi:hypothetical protein